jgi:hypothetical protein
MLISSAWPSAFGRFSTRVRCRRGYGQAVTSTAEHTQVVATARGMGDLVRDQAAESERLRTLAPAIVDEMWATGPMSARRGRWA